MTTCAEIETLSTAAGKGGLIAAERRRLAEHLSRCPACRTRHAAGDPFLVALLLDDPPPPPPDLAVRLAAAAAGPLARRREAGPARRWWSSLSPGLRLATAALWLLGLGLGWQLARTVLVAPPPPPPPSSAAFPTVDLLAGGPPASLVTCYDKLLASGGP